ncbi:MAG: DUF4179 domain-containing protein [Sarcina sp.]
MSIKDFDDIKVPKDIDKAIEKGMKKFEEEESKNVKSKKKKYIGIAAAIVGVITLGASNPAIASKIPFIGSAFEKLEDLNDGKDYKKYATAVNQKVESNGVGITISEAVSDGMYVYLTYVIESNKPFSNEVLEDEKRWEDGKQVIVGWEAGIDFSAENLITSESLIGTFIDKNTFVGMEKYSLEDAKVEIPDGFILTKKVKNIEICGEYQADTMKIKGEWNFEIPITVNKDLTKIIEVNKENYNYKINRIHKSPFHMIIERTDGIGLPDFYEFKNIVIYDEDGRELRVSGSSKTRLEVEAPKENSENIRFVLKREKLAKVSEEDTKDTEKSTSSTESATSYETVEYEKEPIIDIVIPIK